MGLELDKWAKKEIAVPTQPTIGSKWGKKKSHHGGVLNHRRILSYKKRVSFATRSNSGNGGGRKREKSHQARERERRKVTASGSLNRPENDTSVGEKKEGEREGGGEERLLESPEETRHRNRRGRSAAKNHNISVG